MANTLWQDIDLEIKSLEKDCFSFFKSIEEREQTSQDKFVIIEKENLNKLKEIEALESVNTDLKNKLSEVLKYNEDLKKQSEVLQENVSKGEIICNNLRNSMEMNENDNLRLKKAREMYQVGKEFTRIRWDYSTTPNIYEGYISNKDKKSVQTFSFNKDQMAEEKIQEYLWNSIEANSSADWSQLIVSKNGGVFENKENVNKNS